MGAVHDAQLDARTPCEELSLRELVAHVGGLGVAFAAAARKDLGELTAAPPGDGGYALADDWPTRYPGNLALLADAWRHPGAWDGMTQIGGAELPGAVCGMVALTEVVVHGWDVAVATGQGFEVDEEVALAVHDHLAGFAAGVPVEGLFGPALVIDPARTVFERALALSGRDPSWSTRRD